MVTFDMYPMSNLNQQLIEGEVRTYWPVSSIIRIDLGTGISKIQRSDQCGTTAASTRLESMQFSCH